MLLELACIIVAQNIYVSLVINMRMVLRLLVFGRHGILAV